MYFYPYPQIRSGKEAIAYIGVIGTLFYFGEGMIEYKPDRDYNHIKLERLDNDTAYWCAHKYYTYKDKINNRIDAFYKNMRGNDD